MLGACVTVMMFPKQLLIFFLSSVRLCYDVGLGLRIILKKNLLESSTFSEPTTFKVKNVAKNVQN